MPGVTVVGRRYASGLAVVWRPLFVETELEVGREFSVYSVILLSLTLESDGEAARRGVVLGRGRYDEAPE